MEAGGGGGEEIYIANRGIGELSLLIHIYVLLLGVTPPPPPPHTVAAGGSNVS